MTILEKIRRRHHDLGFLLIAVMKLVRGVFLVVVALWALASLHGYCPPGEHNPVMRWGINHLLAVGNHRFIHKFLISRGIMQERNLELICLVSSLYSVKLFIEGIGLWLEKIWAPYLTIALTSAFIPLEIHELLHRVTVPLLVVLGINLLVVAYLVYRLRQMKAARARRLPKSTSHDGG
ncbi:MAG: DUF2127 domain-containing protein [Kiritimatiellaeota bacterium]|nr:DUF2127 domain-containing protein [Kiritimatiellota bacterium]